MKRLAAAALVAGGMLGLSVSTASAALVGVDLLTSGDQLITRDTVNGFDWLDVTETLNLSYDDVINGVGNTWVSGGWRHATTSEVSDFFLETGWDGTSTGYGDSSVKRDQAAFLQNLWGVTFQTDDFDFYTFAITNSIALNGIDRFGAMLLSETDREYGQLRPEYNQYREYSRFSYVGHALVRVSAVPLPAALPLLGGALSLLGFFGWRRKRLAAA